MHAFSTAKSDIVWRPLRSDCRRITCDCVNSCPVGFPGSILWKVELGLYVPSISRCSMIDAMFENLIFQSRIILSVGSFSAVRGLHRNCTPCWRSIDLSHTLTPEEIIRSTKSSCDWFNGSLVQEPTLLLNNSPCTRFCECHRSFRNKLWHIECHSNWWTLLENTQFLEVKEGWRSRMPYWYKFCYYNQ